MRPAPLFLTLTCLTATALPARAGSSGSTELFTVVGGAAGIADGDYVSSSAGLDTYYSFYVEVPAGTPFLEVDGFDVDLGGLHDAIGAVATWNTVVTYSLWNPAGTQVGASILLDGNTGTPTPACHIAVCDNAWANLFTVMAPAAGHWEVRVDVSKAANGDDFNAFGIRAHDSDETAGGTELNVYAYSFLPLGFLGASGSETYTFYPWITADCTWDANDFDADDSASDGGEETLTPPSGTGPTLVTNLSDPSLWQTTSVTGWNSDTRAQQYGLWTAAVTVRGVGTSGNVLTWYAAQDFAPDPDGAAVPVDNPEPFSFRLYLPTDALAQPVKPTIGQSIVAISGASPPDTGMQSTLRITVSIRNPTAQALTSLEYDTTLASGVTYLGNVSVSHGTTGFASNTLTWNVATLPATTTATLSFDVRVTPSSNGQEIPLQSSSQLTYDDEAGAPVSEFQALCALGVTEGVVTHAFVADVRSWEDAGGARLGWRASGEHGTVAWRVLAAGADGALRPLHGGVLSPAADGEWQSVRVPASTGSYVLEEIDRRGRVTAHGPYPVTAGARPVTGTTRALSPARGADFPDRAGPAVAAKAGFATGTRVVRVDAAALARALGWAQGRVAVEARAGRLAVSHRGRAVPVAAANDGSLLFVVDAAADWRLAHDVAWVRPGRATPMTALPAPATTARVDDVVASQRVAPQAILASALSTDPRLDPWFAAAVSSAGTPATEVVVPAPGARATGQATLVLDLAGGTTREHVIHVDVAGTRVGSVRIAGLERRSVTLAFSQALLAGGEGRVRISVAPVDGLPSSVYLDAAELRYVATPSVDVPFTAPATGWLAVTGDRVVLDLAARALAPVDGPGGHVAVAAGRRYVIVAGDGASHAATVWADAPAPAAAPADYLVIAPASLHAGAARLAARRAATGLRARVIDIEDVYDVASHGAPHPDAVRDYLASLPRAPRYVLLVGVGRVDASSLVPPVLVGAGAGVFASDTAIGDLDGDGVAEVAVGRLPVTSPVELDAVIAKIARFEDTRGTGTGVLLADLPDGDAAFGAGFAGLAALFPAGVTRADAAELAPADARAAFLAALPGAAWVGLSGHGGMDRFGVDGLLAVDDLDAMPEGRPVILSGMTCLLNRFELPFARGLGAELLLAGGASPAAVWAPSGLVLDPAARLMGEQLAHALVRGGHARLGDAVLDADARYRALGGDDATRRLHTLLGDPALALGPLPAASRPAALPADEPDSPRGCRVVAGARDGSSAWWLVVATLVAATRRRGRRRHA